MPEECIQGDQCSYSISQHLNQFQASKVLKVPNDVGIKALVVLTSHLQYEGSDCTEDVVSSLYLKQ